MLDIIRDNGLFLLVGQYPEGPLGGLAMTVILALLGLVLSFGLGLIIVVASVSPSRTARWISTTFVTVFRALPLLLLVFWAYYLLPGLTGYSVSAFATLLAALVLYQAAYMAEVIRSGVQGLPKGQSEAGAALGFSFLQRMVLFLLPQALRNTLPSLVGQFVSLVKDTSLGYVIGVGELTYVANQVNSNLLTKPFQVYATLALTYFVVCFSLASFARWLEGELGRQGYDSRRRTSPAILAAAERATAVGTRT